MDIVSELKFQKQQVSIISAEFEEKKFFFHASQDFYLSSWRSIYLIYTWSHMIPLLDSFFQ